LNNSINQYVTKKQETQKDFFQNWEIQDLSSYLVQQKDIIQNEDAHARNVYKQSLIAFQEFENTY
jgi:6-phosphogluconate dehydrogenase